MTMFSDRELHDAVEKLEAVWRWWAKKSDEYPYQVEVPLSLIRDENMPEIFTGPEYGRHISAFLRPGWRTYGFMHKKDADKFIRRYPNRAQHFNWPPKMSAGGIIIN